MVRDPSPRPPRRDRRLNSSAVARSAPRPAARPLVPKTLAAVAGDVTRCDYQVSCVSADGRRAHRPLRSLGSQSARHRCRERVRKAQIQRAPSIPRVPAHEPRAITVFPVPAPPSTSARRLSPAMSRIASCSSSSAIRCRSASSTRSARQTRGTQVSPQGVADAFDPCIVGGRQPAAEDHVAISGKAGAAWRTIHANSRSPITSPATSPAVGLVAENAVSGNAQQFPRRRFQTSSLDRRAASARTKPCACCRGATSASASVLEPTSAAKLDATSLDLDDDDPEVGDRDDEVALALTIPSAPQPQRVPRAPPLGELGFERRV